MLLSVHGVLRALRTCLQIQRGFNSRVGALPRRVRLDGCPKPNFREIQPGTDPQRAAKALEFLLDTFRFPYIIRVGWKGTQIFQEGG
jgi:hypothetical protein